MWFPLRAVTGALGALLLSAHVQADVLEEKLSFGQKGSVSSDLRTVPNWQIEGQPSLLSDRIILTPPWPGNRRAALWSSEKLHSSEWTTELEFRATGPERGGGNLQIWYTKDKHSTSSVYTIGKFDGLALIIDTYGGRGGSIRGFLNDGNVDYKSHHMVDSLAFGHCDYPYRNLGRLTKLRVRQTAKEVEVTVDDRSCFKSDKIKLPADYFFGISAASAETPDSFEAYKFVVTSSGSSAPPPAKDQKANDHKAKEGSSNAASTPQQAQTHAQSLQNNQYDDLKNRLQALKSQLDELHTQMSQITTKLTETQKTISGLVPVTQRIENLNGKVSTIDGLVRAVQKQVEGQDFHDRLTQLQKSVHDTHSSLLTHLPQSMSHIVQSATPRLGVFMWMVIGFQVALAASYVIYKRRRANAPKKYL